MCLDDPVDFGSELRRCILRIFPDDVSNGGEQLDSVPTSAAIVDALLPARLCVDVQIIHVAPRVSTGYSACLTT
jgi:hypothetical protein